jgi:hypothetical protein
LEADDNEHRLGRLPAGGFLREAGFAEVAIFREEPRKLELGCVRREAVDIDLLHNALWKTADAGADVFLEAADHDRVEVFDADLHAAGESLRVEDLQERGFGVVGLDAAGRALLSELLGEIRRETAPSSEAMAAHPERQGVDWRTNLDRTMLDPVIWDLIRTGRRAEAKERLQACLSSS